MLVIPLYAIVYGNTNVEMEHEGQVKCMGQYIGCFEDFIPAPGVPPIRVLTHLLHGPVVNETVVTCATDCAEHGYNYSGITGHSDHHYCYCGCQLNTAVPTAKNSSCATHCSDGTVGPCGSDGKMATFHVQCDQKFPPSAVCGGGKPLPPGPACSQAIAKTWKFCDVSLPLKQRVDDLVRRITVQEAGSLLTARESVAIPRLGLPSFYWGTNAIHGVKYGNATTFPQSLNLGATFNRTLMREVGRVIGREMRALHNAGVSSVGLTAWSPTINIIRDPRWGRNQETISEDPLLGGEYGKQFALGMQYDIPFHPNDSPEAPRSGQFMAVATLKHVLAYSVDDWSPGNYSRHVYARKNFNAVVSLKDLEETYSQPFRRAISEGGAAGIMYACNMVNGVPAVASNDLAERLRSWSFNGYRTTDGGGIGAISDTHRQAYASNIEQSIGLAMRNGESDIDDGQSYENHLVDAFFKDEVNTSVINRALYNTFQIRFRLGLFDPPSNQKWHNLSPVRDVDTAAARQLNHEAATQSLILLQNHGNVLPFRVPRSGRVVVIGASANSTRLLGGGHYARSITAQDHFESIPMAIERLLKRKQSSSHLELHPGLKCNRLKSSQVCLQPQHDESLLEEAINASITAEQVIIMINLQSLGICDSNTAVLQGEEFNPCGYEGEQHDRPHSTAPKLQNRVALKVLAATKKAGVPTVVVLIHGGGMAIDELKTEAGAILDAHYPGEATGATAVAAAIYGIISPAGKLPYTVMPAAFDNMSNFSSMSISKPPGRTYKYYPTQGAPPPLWKFGFGLTYTSWNIKLVENPSSLPGDFVVSLANTGTVDSDEVIQVYFAPQFKRQNVSTPKRVLIDFERVHIQAGKSQDIHFAISSKQLAMVRADGSRVVEKGVYTLEFTNGATVTISHNITIG